MGLLKKAEKLKHKEKTDSLSGEFANENSDLNPDFDIDLDLDSDDVISLNDSDLSFTDGGDIADSADYDETADEIMDDDEFFGKDAMINEVNIDDELETDSVTAAEKSGGSVMEDLTDLIEIEDEYDFNAAEGIESGRVETAGNETMEPHTDVFETGAGDDNPEENHARKSSESAVFSGKDSAVLYEVSREIIKCMTNDELYDTLLFILMGQIGASCASIITPVKDSDKWSLKVSRGVQLKSGNMTFRENDKMFRTLAGKNRILNVDDYSNDASCREEYLKFVSIDGQIVCPVAFNGSMKAAVVLGEKLTIGHYSPYDMAFINSVSSTAGIVAERLGLLEQLRSENSELKKQEQILQHLDSYEEKIRISGDESAVSQIINEEMNEFGVKSYAFFFKDELMDRFITKYNEREDFIGLSENRFSVDINNAFTAFLVSNTSFSEIENPVNSEILKNVFSTGHLTKINMFAVYPYLINENLTGFAVIFRADPEKFRSNKIQIMRFSKTLFMNYFSKRGIQSGIARYVDNYSYEIKRMQNTISESASLDIQVGFAMFGIKNLRRYQQEFGDQKMNSLMRGIPEMLNKRLAGTDYMIRFGFNKFLLVMPGKSKKTAVTFCNALKNEISGISKSSDFQLLVTFIYAEFPEDGKNILSILDVLD